MSPALVPGRELLVCRMEPVILLQGNATASVMRAHLCRCGGEHSKAHVFSPPTFYGTDYNVNATAGILGRVEYPTCPMLLSSWRRVTCVDLCSLFYAG